MKITNKRQFTNGWIMGNFEPAVLKTQAFEIAHHFYNKGSKSTPHIHKVATEYNYIVQGKIIASGLEIGPGDMFIYEPNEVSEVEFLEDTDLIVIKVPSVPTDKYEV